MMDWTALQSGSDIRGVAVGDDAVLTPAVVHCMGAAFAQWLANRARKPVQKLLISIGRDSRITSESLLTAAARGMAQAGAQVVDFGLCTTPAMFMSTIAERFQADGAVMITASHHPYRLNGMKCFQRTGGLTGDAIADLLQAAAALHTADLPGGGSILKMAFLPTYADFLANRIRRGLGTTTKQPLRGLHVVVDAGNGTGGFFAGLLARLGATIRGSQFLDPNGMFPGHVPNPENAEAMASVCAAVTAAGADMGVIFDTDCDRVAVVEHTGQEINRNRLIALLSAILLREQPGQTIVTDSVTSTGLSAFITEKGGKHHRYRRGYRHVIDEAIRLQTAGIACPLAIETSGHAALRENHFLDDGMYVATLLIIEAMKQKAQGRTLGSLIDTLQEAAESREIRLPLTAGDFRTAGQAILAGLEAYAQRQTHWHIVPDNHEGIRIGFDLQGGHHNGWLLLRLSVHDPVMALNLESDVSGGIDAMLAQLLAALETSEGLDLRPAQCGGIH